jgi:hypothetical protein
MIPKSTDQRAAAPPAKLTEDNPESFWQKRRGEVMKLADRRPSLERRAIEAACMMLLRKKYAAHAPPFTATATGTYRTRFLFYEAERKALGNRVVLVAEKIKQRKKMEASAWAKHVATATMLPVEELTVPNTDVAFDAEEVMAPRAEDVDSAEEWRQGFDEWPLEARCVAAALSVSNPDDSAEIRQQAERAQVPPAMLERYLRGRKRNTMHKQMSRYRKLYPLPLPRRFRKAARLSVMFLLLANLSSPLAPIRHSFALDHLQHTRQHYPRIQLADHSQSFRPRPPVHVDVA